MEHNHEIFYDKVDFVIDSSTKAIHSIFNNISLAHKDHNSTIFVFQMPRYIGHHDILLCNKVMIHYTNTDVLTKESFPDNFPVIDMHMDPNDEEKVLFSWRVSINATGHIGSLKFSIEFSCVDEEDVIQWSWNTFEHIGISVKNSQHNPNQVPQIYIDVLEQWKNSGQLLPDYLQKKEAVETYQPKGDYATEAFVTQKVAEAQLGGGEFDLTEFPTVTEADNGKVLGVVNGQWGVVNAPSGGVSSWNDLEDRPFYHIMGKRLVIPKGVYKNERTDSDFGFSIDSLEDFGDWDTGFIKDWRFDKWVIVIDGVEYEATQSGSISNGTEKWWIGADVGDDGGASVKQENGKTIFALWGSNLKGEYEVEVRLIYLDTLVTIPNMYVSCPSYNYIERVEAGNMVFMSPPDEYDDAYYNAYLERLSDMIEAKRAEFVFEFDNGHRTGHVEIVANCTNADGEYHFTTLFPFEFKLYAFDFMTEYNGNAECINIVEVCSIGSLPT